MVFIIKKEIEKDFKESIGKRIPQGMEAVYVFQDTADLPQGYSVPAGRVKPWGTAHAVCAARDVIDSPFVVINADDYYGRDAFKVVFDYLANAESGKKYSFAMVGIRTVKHTDRKRLCFPWCMCDRCQRYAGKCN